MTFENIKELLITTHGEASVLAVVEGMQPQLQIDPELLVPICTTLRDDISTFFDLLSNITAIDNHPSPTMDLIYHLYSIPHEHSLVLKCTIPRGEVDALPHIDSLSELYKGANWHEREIYDFFGIVFNHHPDLRRILLPLDWEGFPLRKDYKTQEYYRGIKVDSTSVDNPETR